GAGSEPGAMETVAIVRQFPEVVLQVRPVVVTREQLKAAVEIQKIPIQISGNGFEVDAAVAVKVRRSGLRHKPATGENPVSAVAADARRFKQGIFVEIVEFGIREVETPRAVTEDLIQIDVPLNSILYSIPVGVFGHPRTRQ